MIHQDERRILESYPEAKIITALKDTVIGSHYHKIKTERFILVSGECEMLMESDRFEMPIGQMFTVLPGIFHSFKIKKGSILVGINSHPYDSSDDYK